MNIHALDLTQLNILSGHRWLEFCGKCKTVDGVIEIMLNKELIDLLL